MTCFEFRRLLLAHPQDLTAGQSAHAGACTRCAQAAEEAVAVDLERVGRVLVTPPDALADKILLRQKMGSRVQYGLWALAATLVVGIAVGMQLYRTYDTGHESVNAATAVGTNHPAVAAISFVLDHEPRLLRENRSGDPEVMRTGFQRLGLKLPGNVSVRYLGKCPVPGGMGDHIVLQTAQGPVTLILVPDYPVGSRVMVADRNMTALANPVANGGGYIVIAPSPQVIREIERMLTS